MQDRLRPCNRYKLLQVLKVDRVSYSPHAYVKDGSLGDVCFDFALLMKPERECSQARMNQSVSLAVYAEGENMSRMSSDHWRIDLVIVAVGWKTGGSQTVLV